MDTILVVDDERHILELVKYNLTAAGFHAVTAETGEEALKLVAASLPDLILLDVMLPGIDGLEVCRRLRANPTTAGIPVIMLTALGDESDKVVGLELGADDYITKPFSVREMIARVKARLRRPMGEPQKPLPEPGEGLVIDEARHQVFLNGAQVDVTNKEFQLLRLLAGGDRVWTREQLLDRVWGYDYYGESRTVDVHIRHLRQKLGDANGEYIKTVRGVGYRWAYKGGRK